MREIKILTTGWEFTENHPAEETSWIPVSIPHDWAIQREVRPDVKEGPSQGFFDRAGIGCYRHKLYLEEKKEDRVYWLEFDGVFELATVWCNETEIGTHRYGYSPFRFDISSALKTGANTIVVQVDNSTSPADRWYSGAGIYREVRFVSAPKLHLKEESFVLSTSLSKENHENTQEMVDNDSFVTGICKASVSLHFDHAQVNLCDSDIPASFDSNLQLVLEVSKQNTVLQQTSLDMDSCHFTNDASICLETAIPHPLLWSAESPECYQVSLILRDASSLCEYDRLERTIGFREVEWTTNGLFVNGNPVTLKGCCLHHDAGCLGSAVTEWTWRKRLTLLKQMGCNAIRSSHNIPDPILLDLCDELGFYVLNEFTDKWLTGSYGRYFKEDWKQDLDSMLIRDRHRACVIAWSVGNEVDAQGSQEMLNILRMLVEEVKKQDSSRPVTCALSPHYSNLDNTTAETLPDRLDAIVRIAQEVDILALNYQEQWYEMLHERLPNTLILGSEIYMFFRAHEYQYMNYSSQNPWMDVEKHAYVVGGFVWAGIEYLGESMQYPSKGWGAALIRSNLSRKPISYLWESYWSETPMVYFTVQDYTLMDDLSREHWSCPRMAEHWNFEQYGRSVIPYMIFSNCEEVELYLNDKRYYVKKPSECESRIIQGYLPYVAGCVRVVGLIDQKPVCEYKIQTAKLASALRLQADKSCLTADGKDVCYIEVEAVDNKQQICFKESGLLTVKVEGSAVLAGCDNGNLLETLPYHSGTLRLFEGKGTIALRSNQTVGRILVSVSGNGFTEQTITLEAVPAKTIRSTKEAL